MQEVAVVPCAPRDAVLALALTALLGTAFRVVQRPRHARPSEFTAGLLVAGVASGRRKEDLDEDEGEGDGEAELLACVRAFTGSGLPVAGMGAGALVVARAMGGELGPRTGRRMLGVCKIADASNNTRSDVVVRLDGSRTIASLPKAGTTVRAVVAVAPDGGNEPVWFELGGEGGRLSSAEHEPGHHKPRAMVTCFSAHPEISPMQLLDKWIPLLDEWCELTAAEAAAIVESVSLEFERQAQQQHAHGDARASEGDERDMNGRIGEEFLRELRTQFFFLASHQAQDEEKANAEEVTVVVASDGGGADVQPLAELRRAMDALSLEVERLRAENAALRKENAALLLLSKDPSPPPSRGGEPAAASLEVRALLCGLEPSLATREDEVVDAEARLVEKQTPVAGDVFREAREVKCKTNALCVAFTNEGHVMYGCTDKTLRLMVRGADASGGGNADNDGSDLVCVDVDAPPVAISIQRHAIPSRILVGTLSGSVIFIELSGSDVRAALERRQVLTTPLHRKHISGVAHSPVLFDEGGSFATISRDGNLVFWGKEDSPRVARHFEFPLDRPPECCSGVVIRSEPFMAIAKRNDHRITLVSFRTYEQRWLSVNEHAGDTHVSFTVLAMAAFKDLPLLACATDKSRVILFDVESGSRVREFFGHSCDEFARPSVAWSADGAWLACTSAPASFFLFRMATGAKVVFERHTAQVRGIAFAESPATGEALMATCSFDKTVLLWRERGGEGGKTV